MSHDHAAVGWENYHIYLLALKTAGVPVVEGEKVVGKEHQGVVTDLNEEDGSGHIRPLRIAVFVNNLCELMVVEEAVEVVDHNGRVHSVNIAVYPLGQCPELETKVLET